MKGSKLNAETKRDLQLLKLRGAYDPKRFYKSSDHKKGFPAHFQMGTVIEGPTDFYSSRLARRDRKQNITEELLHDTDMNDARKRRFGKIQVRIEGLKVIIAVPLTAVSRALGRQTREMLQRPHKHPDPACC